MPATLVHIVAATHQVYGVFADPTTAHPEFKLVVCWGTMEIDHGEIQSRLVAGFCVDDHVEAADFKPNFIGYTSEAKFPDDWRERCKEKLAAMALKAKAAEEQKIIVPADKKLVAAFDA